ncbi:MAG: hypothetical protein HUJ27_17525 [Rhodobacteraceae bacterium]|nr:hypothetical protein [Paracoccaceae bacterium]
MSFNAAVVGILKRVSENARTGVQGIRVIKAASDAECLASILREIRETKLPRHLTFRAGSGTGLCLAVGGRKVFKVVSGDAGELLDRPLEPTDATGLASLLTAFSSAGDLSVVSDPVNSVATAGHAGVGIGDLTKAALNEADAADTAAKAAAKDGPAEVSDWLRQSFDDLKEMSFDPVLISSSGELVAHEGDNDFILSVRKELAEAFPAWILRTAKGLGDQQLLILRPTDSRSYGVCIAADKGAIVATTFSGTRIAKLLAYKGNFSAEDAT